MREGNARPAVSYQRECRICGKKFETRAKKQIYCCQECACAAKTIKEKAAVRLPDHHPNYGKIQSRAYIDMTRRRDWK